jgi:hypothetical protein
MASKCSPTPGPSKLEKETMLLLNFKLMLSFFTLFLTARAGKKLSYM